MPGIIEFPTVVQDALDQYGDLFANECQRRHFAEYLTGLMIAQRKTVLGIHRRIRRDHRSILSEPVLDGGRLGCQTLNERRLEWLQENPSPATATKA